MKLLLSLVKVKKLRRRHMRVQSNYPEICSCSTSLEDTSVQYVIITLRFEALLFILVVFNKLSFLVCVFGMEDAKCLYLYCFYKHKMIRCPII